MAQLEVGQQSLVTADVDELGRYKEKFEEEATVVLRGTLNETAWIDGLLAQIESILGSHKKNSQQQKDRVLISVHGIRTYGKWQANLSAEISQHSRSFNCVEIKYGFFDLISFAIPCLRKKTVEKVAVRVLGCIKNNSDQEIYIVAHSFGTLIVTEALKEYQLKQGLKGVVFCGSPMRHNENIDHVVRSAEIMLNECGTRDFVLILARLFILGLGDAGRVGFHRENSDEFRNRYFSGGHGLYFHKFDNSSTFYERFWVRFIISGDQIEHFDSRMDYWAQDIVDLGMKFFTLLKPMLYIVVPVLWLGNALMKKFAI